MRRKCITMLALTTGVFWIAGCEKPQPAAPAPVAPAIPATAPAAATITTAPTAGVPTTGAASQPASSLMNVNGHMTVFPPALIRFETDGQHLVALVFSDDPKAALKNNYTGNSFYIRMELDVDDRDKLADANWRFVAPSSGDREDSPYGIYLGGRKLQLQPYDVQGRFKVSDDGTSALLSGQFQVVDDAIDRGPPQLVVVSAELPVKIEPDKTAAK